MGFIVVNHTEMHDFILTEVNRTCFMKHSSETAEIHLRKNKIK